MKISRNKNNNNNIGRNSCEMGFKYGALRNRNGCEIGFKYGALRSVSIISDLEACKNYYRRRFNGGFAENIACFNASLSCIHSIHNDKFLPGSPLTCHNKQGQRILTGILNVQWTCANLRTPLIFYQGFELP
ncbi:hypothetical protein Avbf_07682 [Armadillidium vulgare]|nr:hypothetical protein Avbf_07682 [Armadillidium vulgare]